MKKILFVASECVPFIKTGGLADVVGTLPKMFNPEKYDVRVIIPNYTCIPEQYRSQFEYVTHFYMDMGWFQEPLHVGIMKMVYEGITYYFIDNEYYFSGWAPYGTMRFDIEKFCFFSKVALAVLPVIDFKPDVIHCHDWQAGLVPVFLKSLFSSNSFFRNIKVIMTIHNLKFQGIWDVKTIKGITGLPEYLFTPDKLEYYKDANMLKGGLVYADYITTVSETYAGEIQMPYYGEGLDGLLRARNHELCGILNGIDYEVYDPVKDESLYQNYSARNFRSEKIKNKRGLQKQLGLEVNDKKFMIGIISRLTDQKGLDLIDWVMSGICDQNVQLVVVGTGEPQYENMFKHYQWIMSERVSANIFYSDDLAHKLYAAADALLMPSRFEPCGLAQLMALRYGTVPIVRETGGLKDTVQPYNEYEKTGTGFTFANYNADEMLYVINYAKRIYFEHKREWNQMIERGMNTDFSWRTSAKKYEALYDQLTW
ncbi:glycogen synthase GlgA [Cellulosilyticum lentocellum]|uniref:Glycogen synthase n=1 Tax=Cellulosilyticum lentocellum (strain ATCC 49066 / DSM 5427 / NCIMB 11756 / RHM5) TaxID=642492 RepID=F2JP89_CELLD|nr:glycogen synthase GlgA [Cellulosilyticum lentocellum]ADZ84828.1 glycogen/starch synthase, ADP-glucose type [Cellulosilyticum lentocellum DSM 5427]